MMANKKSNDAGGEINELAPAAGQTAEPEGKSAVPAGQTKNESGFYIYIGPNIKGLIQTGSIFRGSREQAYQTAAAAIEKHPKVKTLIVSGDALPEARIKVKTPGNILYANYNELKKPEGK